VEKQVMIKLNRIKQDREKRHDKKTSIFDPTKISIHLSQMSSS